MIVVGDCGRVNFVEALRNQINMPNMKHATKVAVIEFATSRRTVISTWLAQHPAVLIQA